MPEYELESMDLKRRQGRPSAIYRTILVDFLAGPISCARVIVPGKNTTAINQGLRSARSASTLFDEIAIERSDEDVFLKKRTDIWEKYRRRS